MPTILSDADRHKRATWALRDRPPKPQREPAAEPGTTLRLAAAQHPPSPTATLGLRGAAGGSELEALMLHPKWSTRAAVKSAQLRASLTQLAFLSSNPRTGEISAIS